MVRPHSYKATLATVVVGSSLTLSAAIATKSILKNCIKNEESINNSCKPSIDMFIVGDSHDEMKIIFSTLKQLETRHRQ